MLEDSICNTLVPYTNPLESWNSQLSQQTTHKQKTLWIVNHIIMRLVWNMYSNSLWLIDIVEYSQYWRMRVQYPLSTMVPIDVIIGKFAWFEWDNSSYCKNKHTHFGAINILKWQRLPEICDLKKKIQFDGTQWALWMWLTFARTCIDWKKTLACPVSDLQKYFGV